MKDEINTHKQLPGEAMHDTWWRFNQKLKKCPNHDLTQRHLKQDFYRSLNYVTKPIVDVVCGGSFMRKTFSESMQLLDEVSKNNRAWYTRVAEEERRRKGSVHGTHEDPIDLLTKHIVAKSIKVNAVGQQNMYEDQDIDLDEEANYLGNQGGFRNYNFRNQVYNFGNAGRNYAREGQYDRPANIEQGNWQNRDGKQLLLWLILGLFLTLFARNWTLKILILGLNLGHQIIVAFGQFLSLGLELFFPNKTPLDKRLKPIELIIELLGNRDRASGSFSVSKLEDMMAKVHVLEQAGRKEDEVVQVEDLEDTQPIAQPARGKKNEVEGNIPLQQIPRPPPIFPQRLKQKVEYGKFAKFITMLRQLSVNIPLVEALEKMPGYAKFMKDLVTKKRVVSIDLTNDGYHYSAIATRSLVQKKEDPGAFTIPCTIGSIKFANFLCDLGASINLMPLAIYKKLG
ncbi:uncharacterized protein [Solanum tuberosum]|uniref:uncharacterized protein n=1 Tax=Solanum tuberosum TaxID=4113 RepID=UPI00073A076A|nr:PREDICTED: uncharacterized protein LOC107063056 [Solanum tuberosum]